jgi:hypothetical protein
MRKITKTFELFEFNELNEYAKIRAISDHINFEVEVMTEDSPYYHCAIEMEEMQTPWFTHERVYECHKDDIINTIKTNNYLFFEDGELIPLAFYPK